MYNATVLITIHKNCFQNVTPLLGGKIKILTVIFQKGSD